MTKKYSVHIFSLCALFVLADVAVKSSFYRLSWLSLLLYITVSFGLIFLSAVLLNLSQKNKTVFYITVFCVALAAVFGAVSTFLDFFAFLKNILLPEISPTLPFAALLLTVLFFSLSRHDALFKYSLFTAIICAFIIAVCFISSIKNFDFKALGEMLKPNFDLSKMLTFLPIVVLPFFVNDKPNSTKPMFYGAAVGLLSVALCSLQSILIFGADSDIPFSYLRAVGVISSSSLFTRLDGLVYFLFFVTSIIKITVCIKVIAKFIFIKSKKAYGA